MDVNVTSAFLVLPGGGAAEWSRAGRGAIVNVSSLAACNGGGPGARAYCRGQGRGHLADQGARQGAGAARHPRQLRVARPHRRHRLPRPLHRPDAFERPRQARSARPRRHPRKRSRRWSRFWPSADSAYLTRRDDRDQRGHAHAMKAHGARSGPALARDRPGLPRHGHQLHRPPDGLGPEDVDQPGPRASATPSTRRSRTASWSSTASARWSRAGCTTRSARGCGFIFSIVVWSVAAIAHATARTAAAFGFCARRARLRRGRQLARRGQGGRRVVPRARARARDGHLQHRRRGRRRAVAAASSRGWRRRTAGGMTFVITGVLGFVWLGLWLLRVPRPERASLDHRGGARAHPRRTARHATPARRGVASRLARAASATARSGRSWSGGSSPIPIWWLYVFWLPQLLPGGARLQPAAGRLVRLVPVPGGGRGRDGAVAGPRAALIRRGWSVDRARKTVMTAGALLTPAGILAVRAESPYTALALMGVVLFGFQVWVNNLQTLPSDFFPGSAVALRVRPGRDGGRDRERALQLGHRRGSWTRSATRPCSWWQACSARSGLVVDAPARGPHRAGPEPERKLA